MEREFTIQVSVKTPAGFVAYGEYSAGKYRTQAEALFAQLKGTESPDDNVTLCFELGEAEDSPPVSFRTIGCTLDELAMNCKTLAAHTFRSYGLKQDAG
jgi:hypothetical protein